MAVIVLETARLTLSRMSTDDAEFILRLVNEPSFLHFIGDKGVRTLEDARQYILTGPVASYEEFGFGLYLTRLKQGGVPIGMCGLVKRQGLAHADIGFAFVPEFWAQGYAAESAVAVMDYGKSALGMQRILAVTASDNSGSIALLEKIGLRFERMIKLPDDDDEIKLFSSEF